METGDQVAVAAGAVSGVLLGVLVSALGANGAVGVAIGGGVAFATTAVASSVLRNRPELPVPAWLRSPASTGASPLR